MEIATAPELDAQYRVLREAAGVLERPERRSFAVAGTEAADYLQGQLTNDVEALAAGEGCYSALLDRKGRMQGDMRVLRTSDALLHRHRGGRRRCRASPPLDVQGRPRRRPSTRSPRTGR